MYSCWGAQKPPSQAWGQSTAWGHWARCLLRPTQAASQPRPPAVSPVHDQPQPEPQPAAHPPPPHMMRSLLPAQLRAAGLCVLGRAATGAAAAAAAAQTAGMAWGPEVPRPLAFWGVWLVGWGMLDVFSFRA